MPLIKLLRIRFSDYPSRYLFAWTSLRLDRLHQGYRLLQLYDDTGGLLSRQQLLVKIDFQWAK